MDIDVEAEFVAYNERQAAKQAAYAHDFGRWRQIARDLTPEGQWMPFAAFLGQLRNFVEYNDTMHRANWGGSYLVRPGVENPYWGYAFEDGFVYPVMRDVVPNLPQMGKLDRRCYTKFMRILGTGGVFRVGLNGPDGGNSTGPNRVLDWRRQSVKYQKRSAKGDADCPSDGFDEIGYGTGDMPQIDYLLDYFRKQQAKQHRYKQ